MLSEFFERRPNRLIAAALFRTRKLFACAGTEDAPNYFGVVVQLQVRNLIRFNPFNDRYQPLNVNLYAEFFFGFTNCASCCVFSLFDTSTRSDKILTIGLNSFY